MVDKTRGDQSLGEEIIEDLTEFRETLKSGQPIEKKYTVRTVELDLEPRAYEPEDIRNIRRDLEVSQAVFAKILATSVESVESWEQGVRTPPPMACRLLDLVHRHRDHWIKVLEESKRGPAPA